MTMRSESYKDVVLGIITRHLPHATVILFGSRARGEFQQGLDIDIALSLLMLAK